MTTPHQLLEDHFRTLSYIETLDQGAQYHSPTDRADENYKMHPFSRLGGPGVARLACILTAFGETALAEKMLPSFMKANTAFSRLTSYKKLTISRGTTKKVPTEGGWERIMTDEEFMASSVYRDFLRSQDWSDCQIALHNAECEAAEVYPALTDFHNRLRRMVPAWAKILYFNAPDSKKPSQLGK
jgi:hypothetical protein